jgi:hypothetical protein
MRYGSEGANEPVWYGGKDDGIEPERKISKGPSERALVRHAISFVKDEARV